MLNDSTPATVKHLRELKMRTDKNIETRCQQLLRVQTEQQAVMTTMSTQIEDMASIIKLLRVEMSQLRGELVAMRTVTQRLQSEVANTKHIATDCMQNLVNVEQSITLARTDDVAVRTYEKVIQELNIKVMPKLNNTLKYIHHHLEDPNEAINEYRFGVAKRRPNFPNGSLVTASLSL